MSPLATTNGRSVPSACPEGKEHQLCHEQDEASGAQAGLVELLASIDQRASGDGHQDQNAEEARKAGRHESDLPHRVDASEAHCLNSSNVSPFIPGWCLVRQTDGSTAILWVQQHQLPSRHAWVIAGRSPADCASIETCAFLADQVEFVEQMLIRRMPGSEPSGVPHSTSEARFSDPEKRSRNAVARVPHAGVDQEGPEQKILGSFPCPPGRG